MSNFYLKQGDIKPSIAATLTVNGLPIGDLTGGTVRFRMRAIDGTVLKVNALATIVSPTACTVRYDWQSTDTDTPGGYLCEWGVTYSNGSQQTVPNASFDQVFITKRLP